MMQRVLRAVAVALFAATLAWAFRSLPMALAITFAFAGVVFLVATTMPHVGVRLIDAAILQLRTWFWREQQGRHHAFAGVPMLIEDDGRHMWVAGVDLQRVLGTRDAEDVLAARHAGRWRRRPDDLLMLRVDAVVEYLANAPGRLDPRTVALRRYFERDVLFPAAERRRRAAST